MDITRHQAYSAGKAWATEHLDSLRERFTGTNMLTDELRKHLWEVALHRYPSDPDRMENDVAQTAFVAGVLRLVTNKLDPNDLASLSSVFDTALEIGTAFSVEVAKMACLEELRDKGRTWWTTKLGDLAPSTLTQVMSLRFAKEHQRLARSTFEPLKEYFGSREMCIFAELEEVEVSRHREYTIGRFLAKRDDGYRFFDVILQSANNYHKVGEIVG